MTSNPITMQVDLTAEDLATILAALRFYQDAGLGDPFCRPDAIHEIATDGGDLVSLDGNGIDALCERINVTSGADQRAA